MGVRTHAGSSRTRRLGARRGYTLVEVLVVVTILGIAGAMVVPVFSQTNILRVQAAVRQVVADITVAQSDSLAYQTGRAVVFTPMVGTTPSTYRIVEVKGGAIDIATNTLETRDFTNSEYGDSNIVGADFSGTTTLVFDEIGSPITGAGTGVAAGDGYLDITGSGETYRVHVEAYTGRVTVEKR
ncbi:MAG: prepilin-type N-terminal cleavage/methylation domain-containing protein [Phycisphaerales bacterium]|nr:MAG: prepilin-type N-terminal cleavage/methylation domain-containing protein [Phycisphaerales bacterium]